jgi:hypothetical protein
MCEVELKMSTIFLAVIYSALWEIADDCKYDFMLTRKYKYKPW